MNGDVNGTMEEPVELPLQVLPANKQSEQKVTPNDCDDYDENQCENSNNTENSNHVDSEMKNCSTDKDVTENSEVEKDVSGFETEPFECRAEDTIDINSDNGDASSHTSEIIVLDNEDRPRGQLKVTPNDCDYDINQCENSNNTENSNHVDSEMKNCLTDKDVTENEVEKDVSGYETEPLVHRTEDTIVINSDYGDESSRTSEIIVLDNEDRPGSQNEHSNSSESLEVINDNDECAIATEDKEETPKEAAKAPLRRSSRAIKRKRYNDDIENGAESEIEEPLHRRNRPIVINDTKALVEMAAKQMKHGGSQKKEPTVVIIDTNSKVHGKRPSLLKSKNSISSSNLAMSAQNLYLRIAARGTTVTPVSSKNTTATQISQNTQPAILPSLTDDMFVVEAPSFIVPYVYEKPSVKPFREFVLKLGKELDEQQPKKDKDSLDNKEQPEADKEEVVNEDVSSDGKQSTETTKDIKDEVKKKNSSKERRWRDDDDDASWDGESASESDNALSDEEDKIVVKDKTEPIDQIKNVTELTADKICSIKTSVESSMDCPLGKFFINIGLNLVQEFVQNDLLQQQNHKLYKEKKSGQNTKMTESSIIQLKKNIELSKENNAPFVHRQNRCKFCSFKSESSLVMAQHLETPHMINNLYKCNYCSFEIRSPHDILYHMEAEHNVRGKLEKAPAYHQCANCPFEDNGKGKLGRHLISCAKKFKPETNLSPPVDWELPAKIPKISKPRSNSIISPYQNTFNRGVQTPQMANNLTRTPVFGMLRGANANYRPRGRSPIGVAPRPLVQGIPIIRAGSMARQNSPVLMQSNLPVNNAKPKSLHQPSISITPLPRQPPPQVQQAQLLQQNKSSFVICEICDGYIKDLEQLRNHMQWIHKVKIHPKMIYNRPPLNCQKCHFRFFTDQGLERHLLGSHGLVTSSMQEAANKGKDAGRCPVCGRVYQWKLLSHVAGDHNLTLKPAHLSYKCTVCTATFGMYKQFENHVYSAHSVVAKRVMDKSKASATPAKSATKPLKVNDKVTITPQAKPATITSVKEK